MSIGPEQVFYYIEQDKKGAVTLSFAKKSFIARNPQELRVLADVTGQLSQSLNRLLQSDLEK